MDGQNNQPDERDADELNLLDLMVVLLKRRRFIGSVLGLSLCVSAWLAFSEMASDAYGVQAVGVKAFFYDPVVQLPKPVLERLPDDPSFLEAMQAHGLAYLADAQFKTEYDEKKMELTLTVRSVTHALAPEIALRALTAYAATYQAMPARSAVYASEHVDSAASPLAELTTYALGEPYHVPYAPAWPKKALVIVAAAFFLGILAAFMLEYLSRLRSDPEAWAKLQASMKGRRG